MSEVRVLLLIDLVDNTELSGNVGDDDSGAVDGA